MLKLPKTIRPTRIDEVPKNSKAFERLKQIKNANIVEGYIFHRIEKEENEIPFNFYSEININYTRLWDLVISLTDLLPEISALIIGHIDTKSNFGNYIKKVDLLNIIEKYKTELTEDTFLEWGIIFQDQSSTTEIFVTESKYLRFWGMDLDAFFDVMSKFDLNHITDLEFIDEYPKVRQPLRIFNESVIETNELINILKKI